MIPTTISYRYPERNLIVWFIWRKYGCEYLIENGYKTELKIMSFVCWPISLFMLMTSWWFKDIVSNPDIKFNHIFGITKFFVASYIKSGGH